MPRSDSKTSRKQPGDADIARIAHDIRACDRAAIARAITLIESTRADHRKMAQKLVQDLLPMTGNAIRVGITGAPGVGKSLTIDTLGTHLTANGHKVAVLAVDPSSARTGGSILGDKTRMARLATDPNAFVRPSPSAGTLGGVAANTREAMLICEAAGFDVVLVETVGIGQSETAVADMTDFFLVLLLPGAGDQLQGLKKGVVELADMVAVNKSDGDNVNRATAAAAEYRAALQILTPRTSNWTPPVVTYSALVGTGIAELWAQVLKALGTLHRDPTCSEDTPHPRQPGSHERPGHEGELLRHGEVSIATNSSTRPPPSSGADEGTLERHRQPSANPVVGRPFRATADTDRPRLDD